MKLIEYLFRKKMTIGTLAERIGYDRSYLSQVMHGHTKAGKKLAKALEKETEGFITAQELLDGKF